MADVILRTVAADEDGMRLDRWFKAHYPQLGFGQLAKLVRTGQVRVDRGRAKTSTRLATGQSIRVPPLATADTAAASRSGGRPARRTGDEIANRILYQDDDVFAFDKPPGLAVQGGSGVTRHVDGMLEAFTDARGQKPRLVHRLDRDTSGVLLVARTRKAASALAASFRDRRTRKIYWALVKGVPKPRQGRIATLLTRGEGEDAEKMTIVGDAGADTRRAVSLYSVVDHAAQRFSWLSLRPVTGRTHQLRVHTAHLGHPIIGDPKYFDVRDWELPGGIQNKLHLHARRLILPHPSGEGTLDITAPLPPHMQQSWTALGFETGTTDETLDEDD